MADACKLDAAGAPDTSTPDPDAYAHMLAVSGCQELNEALLACYIRTKDWRACRAELQAFRTCFARHQAARDGA